MSDWIKQLPWDVIAVIFAAIIASGLLLEVAIFEQNHRTQQYIHWCVEEGGTRSGCLMRWEEVRRGICQQI